MRRVLVRSGWQGIELTPLDFQIPLGRTMEDALAFVLEMGPVTETAPPPVTASTVQGCPLLLPARGSVVCVSARVGLDVTAVICPL